MAGKSRVSITYLKRVDATTSKRSCCVHQRQVLLRLAKECRIRCPPGTDGSSTMPFENRHRARVSNMKYCQKWRDKKRQEVGVVRQRYQRYRGVVPAAAPPPGVAPAEPNVGCPPAAGAVAPEEGSAEDFFGGPVEEGAEIDVDSFAEVDFGVPGHEDDDVFGSITNLSGGSNDSDDSVPDDEDLADSDPEDEDSDDSDPEDISSVSDASNSSGFSFGRFDENFSSEDEGNDSYSRLNRCKRRLNALFNGLMMQHNLSEAGCQRVHDFLLARSEEIYHLQQEGLKIPKSVPHLRRTLKKKTPEIRTTIYRRQSVGTAVGGANIEREFCLGDFGEAPRRWSQNQAVRMSSYATLKEVLLLAKRNHDPLQWAPDDYKYVDLCIDGVPEGKSCPKKIIVTTLIWPKCQTPYLYRVISARHKCPPSAEDILLGFREELIANGMKLRYLRCDAVERNHMLNMVGPNGLSSCSWCLERGTRAFQPRVTMFPADRGASGPGKKYSTGPRTHAGNLALADLAESTDGHEHEKGIYGHTPLSQIPGFDTVKKVILEIMHALYEGATKRILTASLNLDADKDSYESVLLSRLLEQCKRWSEWPRSPRTLDVPRYKASDFFFILNHVGPVLSLENGVFKHNR